MDLFRRIFGNLLDVKVPDESELGEGKVLTPEERAARLVQNFMQDYNRLADAADDALIRRQQQEWDEL